MSTLSSTASKGEKSKPKFQSLDINSLYRHSRGENTEKTTQKSSLVYIKHGMQSLGKVPSARRAPANLPSLKSEHSGSDAAVPLIPPGATGWGKQDASSPPQPQAAAPQPPAAQQQPPAQAQISQHQANIALPVTTTIPPQHKPQQAQQQQQPQAQQQQAAAAGDKLWSAVAQPGGGGPAPPAQAASAHFRSEFPSLADAAGAGDGPPGGGPPPQAGSVSLRPQAEGTWSQGGAKAEGGPAPPRDGPLPPQVRNVLPPFMCKGNFAAQASPGNNPNISQPPNGRDRRDMSRPPRLMDRSDRDHLPDELTPRPIIKEEELIKLDAMGRDMGWAVSDDVDYNQKLAFSDDEGEKEKPPSAAPSVVVKKQPPPPPQKSQDVRMERQTPPRQWGGNNRGPPRKTTEDEDTRIMQKRQDKEVELAIQRARQRKEEEERRISEEVKQRAAQKLKELDEKKKAKNERDRESEIGTMNPSAVPPKPINHVDIPLPDFQKDKEKEKRSRTPNENKEEGPNFRQLAQIEGKNFPRNKPKVPERDNRDHRQQNGAFSRQFQNDLPPRFMKNQRNNGGNVGYSYDNRWMSVGQKNQQERRIEDEKRDYKRQGSDESYRSGGNSSLAVEIVRNPEEGVHIYEEKWQQHQEKEKKPENDDWNSEKKDRNKEKYERERPESRDSHSTKHSRESEPRDYIRSWSDEINMQYEEKNIRREDRRPVPGPITKDRIEAEDFNEKRNLTQLKKGEIPKKIEKKEEKTEENSSGAWADSIPTIEEGDKKEQKEIKHQEKKPRNYPSNKSWSSNPNDYHSGRNSAAWGGNGNKRPSSRGYKKGDYHPTTDSDNSTDDHVDKSKKSEKDEKNKQEKQQDKKKEEKRDAYIPRGEPSRHGRGGGSSFRGSRMGGMGKRIDGYGPPPSKSPFGHHEDKEKKNNEEIGDNSNVIADKTKQNQDILAAAIIGKNREKEESNKNRKEGRRNKSKSRREDHVDSNSENSDGSKKQQKPRGNSGNNRSRNNGPPRMERKNDGSIIRQNSGATLKKDEKNDTNDKDEAQDETKEEKLENSPDSEGFQEVKSKKNVKERVKVEEKKPPKDLKEKIDRRSKTQNLTQQQIQNIPPLMATPVNPPPTLVKQESSKPPYEGSRSRQSKLAPRFAKQKLQKQYQNMLAQDQNELNKVGVGYGMKEVPPMGGSAWDKPLGPQLRTVEHDAMLGVSIDGLKGLEGQGAGQGTSPGNDKMVPKPQLSDKTLLDGTTPPVNTIIFENTNFKSAPGARNNRDKPRPKLDDDNSVMTGFNKPINELLAKNDGKNDAIQLPLFKEDTADMKLDFFGSDLSHLTDDKTTTKQANMCSSMAKNVVHMPTGGTGGAGPTPATVCNADSLNMKIASVKKVWETSEQDADEQGTGMTFGGPSLDAGMFKGDAPDEQHEGYSPGPSQAVSTSTNVCKVKPTQQVSGTSGQTVLNSATGAHQPHSVAVAAAAAAVAAANLVSNPLSPPPLPPVLGAGVGLGPQQYTANQHLGYQASLGGSTQYGISAIPSPPTVMYNSATQQIQAAAQSGLYGAFQIDQTGVLGGQGRSQFSQYAGYHGLGQAAGSPYSTQSVYLPTAGPPPPHAGPPPTAQPPPPPPELYHGVGGYRLSAAGPAGAQPFGQNQPLSNPTTVLISSTTSNSLMSAAVKPSSQQISAIGTKAGGVGQAYQQQSQQGQQVYMYDPSLQAAAANYLPSAGVIQRAQAAPVQNSVVPTLQASSSFYSGSTGGQTATYFQQPTNSTLQNAAAQFQQHQAATYGLQGSVFGTHSQSHTNTAGLQGYNSHLLSTQMQVAAALSAQQFRGGLPNPYVKGGGSGGNGQQLTERQQQLKSPGGGGQDAMSSVFNSGFLVVSGPQIPSPKQRQAAAAAGKHQGAPQGSPTAQRKYNLYQAVGGQQSNMQQRYPAPIQRPVNFQQNLGGVQNPQKHNRQNSKAPNSRQQYYGPQNNGLTGQGDKGDEPKAADAKKVASVASPSEIVKEAAKEETAALKD